MERLAVMLLRIDSRRGRGRCYCSGSRKHCPRSNGLLRKPNRMRSNLLPATLIRMQRRARLQKLFISALGALFAMIVGMIMVPFAQAQFDSASVLGTIKDPSGSGIPS